MELIHDNGSTPIELKIEKSKHRFEYQELCESLQPIYGKRIWIAPTLPFFTEYKLRKAHDICKQKNKMTYGYLVGVLKRL